MKACVIQPEYSMDFADAQRLFEWEMQELDKCDDSMDIIVMPENSDIPALSESREMFMECHNKYTKPLMEKAAETARRCNAVVFINLARDTGTGERNSTHAFDRNGNYAGYYDKQHLVPSEMAVTKFEKDYTYEFTEPKIITIDGIRYAFLTCYDFYFYESYANYARYDIDVIIGCSHQRSDRQDVLQMINRFLAYHTNAYVIRASVSMGEDQGLGGGSCIIAPDSTVLVDMKSKVGMACAQFDVHKKYYKPAGFGNPDAAHWQYIENGRRPWKYRPGGSFIVLPHKLMPYPRTTHTCDSALSFEDNMKAIGAAIAVDTDEIVLPVTDAADGTFSIKNLDRLFRKFSRHAVFRLDKTEVSDEGTFMTALEGILKKYDCEEYIY